MKIKKIIKSIPFPKLLFIFSICVISLIYGFFAFPLKIFPYSLLRHAILGWQEINTIGVPDWYYIKSERTTEIPIYDDTATYEGLTLITSILEDNQLSAKVINMGGEVIHEWDIDWFEIWPDFTHIPKNDAHYPITQPGELVHGAVLLENGDLIISFDFLGLVRLDVCGNVVWRLPYRTHHSIYLDEFNNLWVPGIVLHEKPVPEFPNYSPPFYEYTVIEVSLDGEILNEISIFDLLIKNNLQGLLYLSDTDNQYVRVSKDTLHLNDVETFPSYMEEGVFKHGDVMISLRNRNAILIFNQDSLEVSKMIVGGFVRQHDPDFIDGSTISVYDNNDIAKDDFGQQSSIRIISFSPEENNIYYTADESNSFYSNIMGKHQWLPNGNLLITESLGGRAFEIDKSGNLVWEFDNVLHNGYLGTITEATRLTPIFTESYFRGLLQECDVN